jgi:hypothetical protein
MIPPFFTVDHRVDSSSPPFEERRVLRRSAPERLRFDVPSPGLPRAKPEAPHPAGPPHDATVGRFARFASMLRLWAPA